MVDKFRIPELKPISRNDNEDDDEWQDTPEINGQNDMRKTIIFHI